MIATNVATRYAKATEHGSDLYLRACRFQERMVMGAAKELVEAKWHEQRHTTRKTRTTPGFVWYQNELTPKALMSLAEWVEHAIDYDGDFDSDVLEAFAQDVARKALELMGYRVAVNADYDWVWENLGRDVHQIFIDCWNAITATADEGYLQTER
jgi:hypothetical protein